jgi:transposase
LGGPKAAFLEEPADHALGRSRGGFGTKVHWLCDSHGLPLGIYVTAGQRQEARFFEAVAQRVLLRRRRGQRYWPKKLAGDKGYSFPHVRQWLKRHHIEPVIPTRSNQAREASFDKASYRRRNIVERSIGWFKECRRLGTRYEKLAVNYVAFWLVAMMDKLLRRK